jgi:hypothetical protein
MSDARVERAARVLCLAANPGCDPDALVHFGEPRRVVLPDGQAGFVAPCWPAEPFWRCFVHAAEDVIAAVEAPDA